MQTEPVGTGHDGEVGNVNVEHVFGVAEARRIPGYDRRGRHRRVAKQNCAWRSNSVYWAVYSNAVGALGPEPGAVLFGNTAVTTTATATGNSTGFGYAEYVFDVDVADFAIGAGTYWLGLHNGPSASTVASEMLWSTRASVIGLESKYFDSTFGWVDAGTHLAFALDGTGVVVPPPGVPEPGTLALVGLAVLAARVARRKA